MYQDVIINCSCQPSIPNELVSDSEIVFSSLPNAVLPFKQRQAALKRMVSKVILVQDLDHHHHLLIAYATTTLIPWLVSALIDQEQYTLPSHRAFFLSILNTLSLSPYPSLHNAALIHYSNVLPKHLPLLIHQDIEHAYSLLLSLSRFQWVLAAIQPSLSKLIACASHILSVNPSDQKTALRLITFVIPKINLCTSVDNQVPIPPNILVECSDTLVSNLADPELKRLCALLIFQSISISPIRTMSQLNIRKTADSVDIPAIQWALSMQDELARTFALQAIVSSTSNVETMFSIIVPELVTIIHDSGSLINPSAVLLALSIMACIAPKLNASHHNHFIQSMLNACWTYMDHSNDTVQARARAVVTPLLSRLNLDPESLVQRVLSTTVLGSKLYFQGLSAVIPIAGPHAVWHACQLDTDHGMDIVICALEHPRLVRRIAEFFLTLTRTLFPKGGQENWTTYRTALASFIVCSLDSKSEIVRAHTISHILEPLFANVPNIYDMVIQLLDSSNLGSRISVDRVARLLNITTAPTSMVLASATHSSPQLRLDALGLLSDVKQTIQPFSSTELKWLRHFIALNMDSCNAKFRDNMFSRLTRIFDRMRNSAYSLARQRLAKGSITPLAPSPEHELLTEYEFFISWVLEFIPALIGRSGCPYATAITGLGILNALIISFGIRDIPYPHGYHPDHCLNPEFPFVVQIDSDQMVSSMFDLLRTCLFDQVRVQTHAILSQFRIKSERLSNIIQWAQSGVSSPRGYESIASALMYDLGFRVCISHGLLLDQTGDPDAAVNYYHHLIQLLRIGIEQSQYSLVSALENVLLPGIFLALETILSHSYNKHVFVENLPDLCKIASTIVLDNLSKDAPEGSVPEAFDEACIENVHADLEEGNPRSRTSQLIMSFSWRVVKHASDLLGTLVTSIDPNAHIDLLESVGDHFIQLMLSIRHRGAFQAVQPNLVRVVTQITKTNTNILERWVNDAVESAGNSGYSVTRRSGGLPYVFLALLTPPDSRRFVKSTMDSILSLARSMQSCVPVKVNAMNITRRLMGDSILANNTVAYIESSLILAMDFLYHSDWAVRNAALMLYSTLLNRVFGSHMTSNSGSKIVGGITAQNFFRRFPKIHTTLITHLSEASCDDEFVYGRSQAFSLLLLITCMVPSPSVGTGSFGDQDVSLATMSNVVSRFLSSPVWKVREVAATAMVALSCCETLVRQVEKAIDCVTVLIGEPHPLPSLHNAVHGLMLYIRNLYKAAVLELGREEVLHATRTPLLDLIKLVRYSQVTPFSQSLIIQIANTLPIENFGDIAIEWYTSGNHSSYGSELVQACLAQAMLSSNTDPSVLITLLVDEQNVFIHETVLEILANKVPSNLIPIPPQVITYLTSPSSPHANLRLKILVDTDYLVPSTYLLNLSSQALCSTAVQVPALVGAMAKFAANDPEIATQYLALIELWSHPEQPSFARISCAASLFDGLKSVYGTMNSVGLVRLVWLAVDLLLVDDELSVREATAAALSRCLNLSPVTCTPTALVKSVFKWLIHQARMGEHVHSMLLTLLSTYLKKTLSPIKKGHNHHEWDKGMLFRKDNANQFKDDLLAAIAVSDAVLALDPKLDSLKDTLDNSVLDKSVPLDVPDVHNAIFIVQYLCQGIGESIKADDCSVDALAGNFSKLLSSSA